MPSQATRDEVQELVSAGAQLVEVLPADEYRWAHLPEAVNLPLKELDARSDQLDRSRPIVVYCHDTICDMSPRAAWRLEAAGFGPVFDYVAGKADWLAADLPFVGDARFIGQFTRRDVPAVDEHATSTDALARLRECGCGPVLVLNSAGVVLGTVLHDQLEAAPNDARVDRIVAFRSLYSPAERRGRRPGRPHAQ